MPKFVVHYPNGGKVSTHVITGIRQVISWLRNSGYSSGETVVDWLSSLSSGEFIQFEGISIHRMA